MSRVTRHLRVGTLTVSSLILAFVPLRALAATTVSFSVASTPKIIITEMQTTGNSASQEFVELYNTTDTDIDMADLAHSGREVWKLQFFSATSASTGKPDWTKPSATVALAGVIAAHDYFVLASTGYAPGGIESDQAYSPRLSDTGGGLQLVTASSTAVVTYDRLQWKQPADTMPLPEGVMATPVAKGSLQRLPNDDSDYVGADNSLTDFIGAADISPKDMWQAPAPAVIPEPVPVTVEPTNTGTTDGTATPPAEQPASLISNAGLASPYLTELLPNPAAPLTDAHDEYIELYNPNARPFDLNGYTLEVGTTTLHDFTFAASVLIEPLGYRAFYAVDTGLSLANTGGQARLLDPAGAVISETQSYAAATDGTAWARAGDATWQWTTTLTPAAENVLTSPVTAVTTAAVVKPASTANPKKPVVKTASAQVKGVSSTKVKKAVAPKAKKSAKVKAATVAQASQPAPRAPIHTGVLVGVAVLAVLYAAYEYRTDLSNRLYKLRHHRTVRKFLRGEA